MLRTRVRAGPVAGLVMSLAFAIFLTLVQTGDRLVLPWTPAYGEPTATALRVPYGPRFVRIGTRTRLQFEAHRTLIPPGTVLNPEVPAHQSALLLETAQRPPSSSRLAGVFVVFLAIALAFTWYLRKYSQNRLGLMRVLIGVLVAMGLLVLFAKGLLLFTALPATWVPMATVPLVVATAFDRRTAAVVAVVLAVVVASLVHFDLVLLCVLLARGVAASLFYLDRRHPRQMLVSGGLAGLAAAGLYAAVLTTFEGGFDVWAELQAGMGSDLYACVGGGLASGLLGAILRAPAERLLGNVPRERLLELQDLSQPLLRKLAKEAPGTFEHSRAMANLAEQAASAIGGDALLTRVGAYYHDLGKTAQAKYFVENLLPDEPSPHDALAPEVSADAIMAHVVVGTKILREGGIPEPVVEFCYTHHGTSVIEYFWTKYQQREGPLTLTEAAFTYPGMKPQTKETGILMLVDSIEAASRTVDHPTRDHFQALIQRIVFTKLQQGQLDECGLDLSELRVITTRMTDTLVNMYHHRIKYQWQVKRAEEFGVPSQAVRASSPDIEMGPMQPLASALRLAPEAEKAAESGRPSAPATGSERPSGRAPSEPVDAPTNEPGGELTSQAQRDGVRDSTDSINPQEAKHPTDWPEANDTMRPGPLASQAKSGNDA